ncbi:MAG TPA: lipocalin family protein [Pedobacter sp.]|nr:lipocalin family protein [Pedobacter sp.]
MNKLNLIIALLACLVAFSGCKKVISTSERKAKLLTDKHWKLTAFTINDIDQLGEYEDCEEDDFGVYLSNGTYQVNEGATKCEDDAPQVSEYGRWELMDSKLIISNDEFDLTITYTIVELGAKKMIIELKDPDGPDIYKFTYTAI